MLLVGLALYDSDICVLTKYSDKWWNPSGNQVTPATQGVSAYPRALNGYFSQQRPNGATVCINLCLGANKGYIYAGTNDNSCCTF
jgi:hypothetical protein